eukprot:CAMPEP_0173472790 /NCGR_PEP_ID=MMETSP1357-20121228/79076_1 /TAXON_ID=77926 /ORGANISM="Hemiselmis rufescens, Strain PCC563" /LENGTH=625 /DNA_ID=CAMNT_0014441115 /DNA_START=36 /DNA_END=1909 /DNA_ORIENTATION=-
MKRAGSDDTLSGPPSPVHGVRTPSRRSILKESSGNYSPRSIGSNSNANLLSLTEESHGTMKTHQITPEEATSILDSRILENLSPAENAIMMQQDLLNSTHLTKEERISIIYTIQVLQADPDGAGVPFALQTEYEDEMGDEVNDWLLQDFSGLSSRSEKKHRSHMSMKSLARGVLFALRVQRSLEKSRPNITDSYQNHIPFDCTQEEADEIFAALSSIEEWGWDVRPLVAATKGRPLQALGYHVLKRDGCNFAEQFSLDNATLKRWLELVETSYTNTKYHNSAHAADVLQSVFSIICMEGHRYLSEIEQMALVMAAMVHDMGHDGMSNIFHKNALTQRALDHNDQSIQENFHAASLFTRMAADESVNIFKHLSKQHFTQIRQILIHCLLHTDMSKHFVNLKEFKGMIDAKGQVPDEWVDESDVLMAIVLHTADIGAQAKPVNVAKYWAQCCMQEFWEQGDKEKELGLPISPQCNRESANVPSAQVGFIKYIVQPSFEALGDLFPVVQMTCLPMLKNTLSHWQQQEANDKEAAIRKDDAALAASSTPNNTSPVAGDLQNTTPLPLPQHARVRRQSMIHKNVIRMVSSNTPEITRAISETSDTLIRAGPTKERSNSAGQEGQHDEVKG